MKNTLILVALIATVSFSARKLDLTVWAAAPQAAQEGKGCTAPKEWGALKGVADRAIAFEDASGKIRILDLGPCMRGETQLIVTINRQ